MKCLFLLQFVNQSFPDNWVCRYGVIGYTWTKERLSVREKVGIGHLFLHIKDELLVGRRLGYDKLLLFGEAMKHKSLFFEPTV